MSALKRPNRLVIFSLAILALTGCQRQPEAVVRERFLLDTLVTIVSYDADRLPGRRIEVAEREAFARMRIVERRLNIHDRKSEAAKVDLRALTRPTTRFSTDLRAALAVSAEVKRLTDGAFDPAIGAVTKLWRFDKGNDLPSRIDLRHALASMRRGRAETGEAAASRLDLGGVAKGIAVDRAGESLRAHGLKSFMVTSSSSSKVSGPKPGGKPWTIGIQSPRPKTTPGLIGVVSLRRGSVSTSGDYQQFFMRSGRRYHHILDPKTGYPARGFMSVTVVTDRDAAFADALSTGLAVMGRVKAMKLVEKTRGVGIVFVDGDGRVWVSPSLRSKVRDLVEHVE